MKRAFTLVEILVVLAIIAILAAFSYPAFSRARAEAKVVSSMSKMKQWSVALNLYRQDHEGPVAGDTAGAKLASLGFTTVLFYIGQHSKLPSDMNRTGGSPIPSVGVDVYVNMISLTGTPAESFLKRYESLGDQTVWLVDITQNPTAEIYSQAKPRVVLGASLDSTVRRKRVKGDLTRTSIWDNE